MFRNVQSVVEFWNWFLSIDLIEGLYSVRLVVSKMLVFPFGYFRRLLGGDICYAPTRSQGKRSSSCVGFTPFVGLGCVLDGSEWLSPPTAADLEWSGQFIP